MPLLQLSIESTQRRALLALLECLSYKLALLALLQFFMAARPWSTRLSLTPFFATTPRPFAPLPTVFFHVMCVCVCVCARACVFAMERDCDARAIEFGA